jgi:dienelactone hydrolase
VAGPPQEATARPAAAVAEPAAAEGDETVTVHVAVTRPPDHFDVRKFTYRTPAGAAQRRPASAVIVIPMLGGSPFVRAVSRDMCESLRSEGFAALYLDDARSPVNDHSSPEDLEDALAAGTAEIRAALDWLSQRPEIDADRIGAVGISLGGIRPAIAAAVDRRLKANFIAFAGADIPDIIFGSGQARVRAYRDRLVARFGSEPAARAALSASLRTDPVHLAGHVDARRVLLVLASFDGVAPVKNGKLLYERLGRPETVWLPTGHYGALVFSGYVRSLALQFLAARPRSPAPPTRPRPGVQTARAGGWSPARRADMLAHAAPQGIPSPEGRHPRVEMAWEIGCRMRGTILRLTRSSQTAHWRRKTASKLSLISGPQYCRTVKYTLISSPRYSPVRT